MYTFIIPICLHDICWPLEIYMPQTRFLFKKEDSLTHRLLTQTNKSNTMTMRVLLEQSHVSGAVEPCYFESDLRPVSVDITWGAWEK